MTREEILSSKAHDIDVRTWLVDILKRIPTEKDINQLLPGNWKVRKHPIKSPL